MKDFYVDKEECTGCQACIDELPKVFKLADGDVAEVQDMKGASEEEIQDCMDNCPAECIHWK